MMASVGQIQEGDDKRRWQRLGEGPLGEGRGAGTLHMSRKEGLVSSKSGAGMTWPVPGTWPFGPEAGEAHLWSGTFWPPAADLHHTRTGRTPDSGVHGQVHQPQALGKDLHPSWACLPPAKEPLEGTGSFSKLVFTEPCTKQCNWTGFVFAWVILSLMCNIFAWTVWNCPYSGTFHVAISCDSI